MKRIVVIMLTAIIAAGLALVSVSGPANAATPKAVLGGGSGIITPVNTDKLQSGRNLISECTLTVLARDQKGELFGLTAGHCANPGRYVYAEGTPAAGEIGRVVARWKDIDIEVIRFLPNKVIPTKSRRGVTISHIGRHPVGFPQTICIAGRTSNKQCGFAWGVIDFEQFSQVCSDHGDSGGPIVAGTTLIGMVNRFTIGTTPCLSPMAGTTIDTIRAAVRALGITSMTVA